MTVGHWILILLFGGVLLFGTVLSIHTHGFARGYEQGYKDAMLMFNKKFLKPQKAGEQE